MTRACIISSLFLLSIFTQAQDVHYSQFNKTKALLNPSLIAYQNDDYEMQIQRRSQWASITTPFNTFSLSFNAKQVYKGLSMGATILNDLAGDSDFSTKGLSFSLANFFNTRNNTIFAGLQTAFYQRSINYDNLIFIENETFANTELVFFDFAMGISNYKKINQNSSLLLGFSSYHLNKPNQSLISSEKVFLNPKYVFHLAYYNRINSKIDVSPTLYISLQNTDNEIVFGGDLTYELNQEINLKSGVYSRINDAFLIALGIQKANLEIIASYDINTSTLVSASNFMGAFEFSIRYGWSILKEKKEIKQKVCPKYL